MKRQRTQWVFNALFKENNFIRVGWVFNKHGYKLDKVRMQIYGKNGFWDLYMRIDEAVCIAAGLNKVLAKKFVEGLK